MFQWDDGTMAYFSSHTRHKMPPSCGTLNEAGIILIAYCNNIYANHFICEAGDTQNGAHASDRSVQGIQLPRSGNTSIHLTHVVCPSGHWTHEFLACDSQSACRPSEDLVQSIQPGKRRKTATLCQSQLSASFSCRTGAGDVPYSLVCDHSQDCLDASDEDFCVHPSCSVVSQFECTNGQVRNTGLHTHNS